MVTFKGSHPVALAALLFAALTSACTNGNFSGGNKKVEQTEKKPEKKPENKPVKPAEDMEDLGTQKESEPVESDKPKPVDNTDNDVVTPTTTDTDVVVPENTTDTVTTTTQPPVVDTTTDTTTTSQPPVVATPPGNPETDESVGSLQVPVTCFVNMEHGYHGTDENYIVQLVDSSGSVVAAGYSTIDAVRNGTPTDGRGAYPGMLLNFDLTWLKDTRPAAGSGTLNVCYSDPNLPPEKGSCQSKQSQGVPGDGERPTSIQRAAASWTVSEYGGKPQIKVSGNYNLSTHHPVWGLAKAGACFKDYQSPLVLDLNKNGKYDLVDVWDDSKPVRFDINADGKTVRTGWVRPTDGLLALDLNGNCTIDNGLELFGEYTKGAKAVAAGERSFENGFQALAQYDSNMDGRINKADTIFAKLLVWTDLNQDGISQPGELKSLSAHKIADISLAYSKLGNLQPAIVANNEVRLESSYTTENGAVHLVSDVWFKQRRYSDKVAGK
jgi:hypothetical protein